jgi:phosphoribosylformylglycinamidine synthase PurS subunit
MTKVFIGGSRNLSRLNDAIRKRLENIVMNNLEVLVGDANGADKSVQEFFKHQNYSNVIVYCSGSRCRNNVGHWTTEHVVPDGPQKGFQFYAAKDRAMAAEANHGFMIWDGKSSGTLLNVFRLVKHDKKVVLYVSPQRKFQEFKSPGDWENFFSTLPWEFKYDLTKKIKEDNQDDARTDLLAPLDKKLPQRSLRARVFIMPKEGVLDPQGKAIGHALGTLGFQGVGEVRQGKMIEIEVAESDQTKARAQLDEMCEKLLANTVIESYRVEIVE